MKRPLFLVCIALAVLMAFIGNAGSPDADSPAFYDCESCQMESAKTALAGEAMLVQAAEQEKVLTLKGCVVSCSAVSEGKRLSVNQLSVLMEDGSEISLLSELKLILTTEQNEIAPGDFLAFSGEYSPYQEARNPGNFDTKAYYLRENVIGKMKNLKLHSVDAGKMDLPRILYTIREKLRISCEKILDEKKGRTLSAICLGEKSNMEQEWKNTYQEGGISHILAVSGLHITMIGMSVFHLLRRMRTSYVKSALCSGVLALCYVLMTGNGVSAWRALLMFFLWLGAQVCGRKYDMRTSMAIAAFLLIWSDASSITTTSFCLSFGAVAAIAILLPCIKKTCSIKNQIADSIVGSVGIFLGTLPVTLYFFYQAAPWSMLVNLFVVAMMPSVMGMGLLASSVGIFAKTTGIFLAAPVNWLLVIFELLCRMEQYLPGMVWVTGQPKMSTMGVYYTLLVMTGIAACKWRSADAGNESAGKQKAKKPNVRRRNAGNWKLGRGIIGLSIWKVRLLWIGISCICIALMVHQPNQNLQITCLDVGQGDCSLIQFPDGTNCLIDGGSSSEQSVWEYRIDDTVKYYGIDTLDYVFLSHADSDHTSGILEFLQEYQCGWKNKNVHGITIRYLVLPPTADAEDFAEIRLLAAANKIAVLSMECDNVISAKDWSIACLAPSKEALSGDKNEDSMVLMLQYQQFHMLFTGDLEGEAEQELTDGRSEILDADVLKVGHHGSKNASSDEFLAAVSPQIAVISCGEDNSYGHPSKETVERLEHCGAHIFETQTCGAVQIISDGYRLWTSGYLKK